MIFHELEHWIGLSWVLQTALIAGGLLLLGGLMVRRRVAVPGGGVLPDEGVTIRNILEVLVEWLAGLARDRMGPDWRTYFPLVGTMFFFILISNLMGLIPGSAGATSDVNTTAGWAIMSWVFYTAIGIAKHRHHYLIKFLGPSLFEMNLFGRHIHVRLLAPLFFVLEVPLDLARMITLAMRLLANMFGDHMVVGVWLALVPVVIPAVFMGLGLVVSFLQAFVFALLTMVYIGLALDEPH
jgi:F-type H+-transporting ATPase subunit a